MGEKQLPSNSSQSKEFEEFRKKKIADLDREERIFGNAIWMLENGALNETHPLTVIDTLIRASVQLRLVRQTKAIATGIATAKLKINSF